MENISSFGNTVTITPSSGLDGIRKVVELAPKHYPNPKDVVEAINAALGTSFLRKSFNFSISELEDRCLINFKTTNRYRIQLAKDVAAILGFEADMDLFDTKPLKSNFHPSWNGSKNQIMLYMDGLTPTFFAGTKLNLFSIIPWYHSRDGRQANHFSFEENHWHRLEERLMAKFELRNISGTPVAFPGGAVLLHCFLKVA